MSEPLASVLAIDGGNSKTDVALVASDGELLGQARGGGSNPQGIGMHEAFGVLRGLVLAAAEQAGIAAAAGGGIGAGGVIAGHTSACLAGADLPEEEQQLTELVQAQGWSRSSSVVNDTFAVLRAGLDDAGDHWGIGVTCGAGLNCVGVAPDGETTRFLSLGEISGDWGGGGDLARDALWWAARAEDGRGPDTELRTAIPAHFGLAQVRDVTLGRYHEKISAGELHGLVPVVFGAAGRGDQVARDLLLRLASEICVMVTVAARRLGLTQVPVPVVLGGGVITARDPLLTSIVVERLAADLPHAVTRINDVPAVTGAALLGLDHAGAPPSAARRLRACYPG